MICIFSHKESLSGIPERKSSEKLIKNIQKYLYYIIFLLWQDHKYYKKNDVL